MIRTSWRDFEPSLREEIRKEFENVERTAEQKRKDLVKAFDDIHELKCKQRSLKNRLWVLSGVVIALCAMVGWLADHLYDCLEAAHHVASVVR